MPSPPRPAAPPPPVAESNGQHPAPPLAIPSGTRRLLAGVLLTSPNGQALLKAFGDDHDLPTDAKYTLVIDAAHLEPVTETQEARR